MTATTDKHPVCPECGKSEGGIDTGQALIGFCKTHRVRWVIDYWSWKEQGPLTQAWKDSGIEAFTQVEPVWPQKEVPALCIYCDNVSERRPCALCHHEFRAQAWFAVYVKAPGINPVCDECAKKHDPHLFQATKILEAAHALKVSQELLPFAQLCAAIHPDLEAELRHPFPFSEDELSARTAPLDLDDGIQS
jgi:hypothetical protein